MKTACLNCKTKVANLYGKLATWPGYNGGVEPTTL